MRILIVALAVGALAVCAGCSRSPRLFSATALPGMTALICELKVVHEGALNPAYERGGRGGALTLTLANLDDAAGTARVVGNAGTAQVQFTRLGDQLRFVEVTPTGNVTLLSVYAPPAPAAALPAAYSRHILIAPANIAISQYAGSCQPKV